MQITITLHYGPLSAEFSGDNREQIEGDLLEFINFLEENEARLEGLEISPDDSNQGRELGDTIDSSDERGTEEGELDSEHPLVELARKTDTAVDVLDDIIYVDPDGEELPQPLIDKNILGGNKTERQRNAAYLILRVWEDCYGNDRMKTSILKEILTMANISDIDLYNAWAGPGKGDFDSTGRGDSATVGLTGPGKRQAIKLFQTLAEDIE